MSRAAEHTLMNVSPRMTLLQLMRYICSRDGMKTSEAETPRSMTRRVIQMTMGKGNKTLKHVKVCSTTKDYTNHLNELLHGLFDRCRNQLPPCLEEQRAAFSGDVSSLDASYFDLAFAFCDARNNITPIDRIEDTQVIHCFQQHFNLDAAPPSTPRSEHLPPLNLYLYVRLEGNTLRSTPLLPSSSVPLGGSSSVLHLTLSDARFLRRLISPDRSTSRSLKMTSSAGSVPSTSLSNSSSLDLSASTPSVVDDSSSSATAILAMPPGLETSQPNVVSLVDHADSSSSDLLENQAVRKYIAQILDGGLEPLTALRPKRVPSKLDSQAFIARIFGSVVEFPLGSDPSDFDKPIVLIASRQLQFLPWELMFGEPTVRYPSIAGLLNLSSLTDRSTTSPPPNFIVLYDSSSTKERQSAQNIRKRALSRAVMQRFNLKDSSGGSIVRSGSSEALVSGNVVLPYDTGLVRPGHKPKQRKYRHVHFIDLHGVRNYQDLFGDDVHPFRVVLMQMADFVDSSELVHYLLAHPITCTLVFIAETHFLFAVTKLNKMMEAYAKHTTRTSHRTRAPYLQKNERYFFLTAGIQSLQRDHAVPLIVVNAPLFG